LPTALRITDIDPLKYDLLFERFLNPDRISMPDIDIDFDDDGRHKVSKICRGKIR
jgi:DNA polymerase III subunit alpha